MKPTRSAKSTETSRRSAGRGRPRPGGGLGSTRAESAVPQDAELTVGGVRRPAIRARECERRAAVLAELAAPRCRRRKRAGQSRPPQRVRHAFTRSSHGFAPSRSKISRASASSGSSLVAASSLREPLAVLEQRHREPNGSSISPNPGVRAANPCSTASRVPAACRERAASAPRGLGGGRVSPGLPRVHDAEEARRPSGLVSEVERSLDADHRAPA